MLIEPKRLPVAFFLARPENPAALGMKDSLVYEIIYISRILKRRVELNQGIGPQSPLIKTRSDERINARVPNPNKASDIRRIVGD
jgi:hypothetical protein